MLSGGNSNSLKNIETNIFKSTKNVAQTIEELINIPLNFSNGTLDKLLLLATAIYIPVAYSFKPSADLRGENNYRRFHAACVQTSSFFFGISLAVWISGRNTGEGGITSASLAWSAILVGSFFLLLSTLTNNLQQKPVDGAVQRIAYSTSNLNLAMIGLVVAGTSKLLKLNTTKKLSS